MSFRDRQAALQRRAEIAQGYAQNRARAKQAMGNFFGGMRDRFQNFSNRINQNQQGFGTSPLQQALAQEATGNITPQAARYLAHMRAQDPDELSRQADMMQSGRHGGNQPIPDHVYNPVNTTEGALQAVTGEQMAPAPAADPAEITVPEAPAINDVAQAVADGKVNDVQANLYLQKLSRNPEQLSPAGVAQLQELLNRAGMTDQFGKPLEVDEGYGPKTEHALKMWKATVPTWGSAELGAPLEPVPANQYKVQRSDRKWDWRNDGNYQNVQDTVGHPLNSQEQEEFNIDRWTNPLGYNLGQ